MKAIVISEHGSAEVLKLEERPTPTPKEGEVLIRVKACGVNRPDIFQREGKYPAPEGAPQDILGLEVAGVVDKVSDSETRWKVGDKVCALLAGGGYAEFATAPSVQCLPIPGGLSFAEASALPETFFTVWSNVFDRGGFQKGESVLVHGGTSGIGVATIQLVKSMGGTVFATAGTDEKCAFAEKLGATKCVNYKKEDFKEIVKSEFGGVDIVLDMVGGDYTQKNIDLLKTEGRLVIINAMKSPTSEINMKKIMVKRLQITGSTLRARSPEFKYEIAQNLKKHIWSFLESGEIKPIIHQKFPLEQASEAHKLMESSEHIGKIVLEVD